MGQLWSFIAGLFSPEGSLLGYAILLAIIAVIVIFALTAFPPVSQIFMDTYCLQDCANQ